MSSDLEALSIFPVDLFFFCLPGKLSCYVPVFKENFTNEFTWTLYFSVKYKSKLMILLYHRGFLTTRLFTVTVFSNWPFSARAHVTYSYLKPKLGDTVCSNVKCGVCKQKTAAVLGCFLTISDSFSCTRKAIWYSVKRSYPKPEN